MTCFSCESPYWTGAFPGWWDSLQQMFAGFGSFSVFVSFWVFSVLTVFEGYQDPHYS